MASIGPPVNTHIDGPGAFTEQHAELKRRLVPKEREAAIIKAWNEVLEELSKITKEFTENGQAYIPQVDFSEIQKLPKEKVEEIKKRGCVLIRNVVDDEQALRWKEQLRDYVNANPSVDGFPEGNKQFFEIYWSKSQIEARSHPHVLSCAKMLNSLWHAEGKSGPISLSTPITSADRFRIRLPTPYRWTNHSPHIDGGNIERWADPGFNRYYENILRGSWRDHDSYTADLKMAVNSNFYGRPNQGSVFRAWQGWLSMSDTGPNEGTLQLFPDVLLSSAYVILRPFFRIVDPSSPTPLDPSNWVLDLTTKDFPGITPIGKFFTPIKPTPESHPHLRLREAMVSIPKVAPGDMIYWHNDVIHAVEFEHHGKNDSSVMYIGAGPLTIEGVKGALRQRANFFRGLPPPQFPQGAGEFNFINKGTVDDIQGLEGKRAMAIIPFDESEVDDPVSKEAVRIANELIAAADAS